MSRTVDIHAHLVPPSFLARVDAGEFQGVRVVKDDRGVRLLWGERESAAVFPALRDPAARIDYMDRHGIDVQVLSNWAGAFGYELPESSAASYCQAFNQEMARLQSGEPRFRAMATLPMQFPDQAADVLRDAVAGLGLHGVEIGTNILGVPLDDPRFNPLWHAAVELSSPIVLHPVNVAGADRLSDYYLANLLGNPFDTTIAAARLMLGGVFDRYPGLQVVLLHGGGYGVLARGRLEHGRHKRPETGGEHPVDFYLHNNFFTDTVIFDPAALRFLVEAIGPDRILLGTDCPFDMGQDDAAAFVRETVPANLHAAILSRNAEQLFSV